MKKILLYSILLLLFSSTSLFAQYTGGAGDGYAMSEILNVVSIKEVSTSNSSFARAFPNPLNSRQQLHIELEQQYLTQAFTLELHNAVGQIFYRKTILQPTQFITLPLLSLPKGIYSLAIKSEQYDTILKIVQL